jgi:hypothetical protein
MAKYLFLSDEWVAQARRIYAELQAAGGPPPAAALASVRVNLVVYDAPFSAEPLQAHVDTSAGHVAVETGHLDRPDVTVSLDWATARSLFVGGDPQAAMQAFLSGRMRVDGDMSKLLDPGSGMWPATGPGMFRTNRTPPGGPGTAGSPVAQDSPGGPAQEAMTLPRPPAFEAAARLQEITE